MLLCLLFACFHWNQHLVEFPLIIVWINLYVIFIGGASNYHKIFPVRKWCACIFEMIARKPSSLFHTILPSLLYAAKSVSYSNAIYNKRNRQIFHLWRIDTHAHSTFNVIVMMKHDLYRLSVEYYNITPIRNMNQ